jgi:hypothetical protein
LSYDQKSSLQLFQDTKRNMFLTSARMNLWDSLTPILTSLQALFLYLSKQLTRSLAF